MAQPDPYEEWPVIEEEQLHDQVACLIKNQPEGSLLKQIFHRVKRTRRRHKKQPQAIGDMHKKKENCTPSIGNIFRQFSLNIKQFCPSCVQVARKEILHLHEPP